MDDWIIEWVNGWINKWMDGWMNEWKIGCRIDSSLLVSYPLQLKVFLLRECWLTSISLRHQPQQEQQFLENVCCCCVSCVSALVHVRTCACDVIWLLLLTVRMIQEFQSLLYAVQRKAACWITFLFKSVSGCVNARSMDVWIDGRMDFWVVG